MAARRSFYYSGGDSRKDATKKLKEVSELVKEAEALLLKADKLSREAGVPFKYGFVSSDGVDAMAERASWVASTCSGGSESENWDHITGTPKEKEYERDEEGYIIEDESGEEE